MASVPRAAESWDPRQGEFQYGPGARPARPAPQKSKQSADRSLKITAGVATLGALGMLALYQRQRARQSPSPELTTSVQDVVLLRQATYAVQSEAQSVAHLVAKVVEEESTERRNLQAELAQLQARLNEAQERDARERDDQLMDLQRKIDVFTGSLQTQRPRVTAALQSLQQMHVAHLEALRAAEARYDQLEAQAQEQAYQATASIKLHEQNAADALSQLAATQADLSIVKAQLDVQRQRETPLQEKVARADAPAAVRPEDEAAIQPSIAEKEASLHALRSRLTLQLETARSDEATAKLSKAQAEQQVEEHRMELERLRADATATRDQAARVSELLKRFATHAEVKDVRDLLKLIDLIGDGSVAVMRAWGAAHADAAASIEDADTNFFLLVVEALVSFGAPSAIAALNELHSRLAQLEAQRQQEEQRLGDSMTSRRRVAAKPEARKQRLQCELWKIEKRYRKTQAQLLASESQVATRRQDAERRVEEEQQRARHLQKELASAQKKQKTQAKKSAPKTKKRKQTKSESRAATATAEQASARASAAEANRRAQLQSALAVLATTQQELAQLQKKQLAWEDARTQHQAHAVTVLENAQNVVQSMLAAAGTAGQSGKAEANLRFAVKAVTQNDPTHKQHAIMQLATNYERLSNAMVGLLQTLHGKESFSEQRERWATELANFAAAVSQVPFVTARLQENGVDQNSLHASSLLEAPSATVRLRLQGLRGAVERAFKSSASGGQPWAPGRAGMSSNAQATAPQGARMYFSEQLRTPWGKSEADRVLKGQSAADSKETFGLILPEKETHFYSSGPVVEKTASMGSSSSGGAVELSLAA